MCKLHLYAKTFNGAVFHCWECKTLHVLFGTVQFSMDKSEFDFFCKAVCSMYDDSQKVPIARKYIAHLCMDTKVSMVLNSSQIEELRSLLFKAKMSMSNKQTLELLIERQKNSYYLN